MSTWTEAEVADHDRWLAEQAEQEAYERQLVEEIQAAATAWRKLWPNACTHCHGSGGSVVRNYPHAPDDFEICEALPADTCHRCGWRGMGEDSEGPCKVCGWDYDDSEPSL